MRTRPIPGPWHYETNGQGNVVVYATRSGDDDKIIIGMSHFGPLEVREANARQICGAATYASPAEEIAKLAERILELAPTAGLYVGIDIKPAEQVSA